MHVNSISDQEWYLVDVLFGMALEDRRAMETAMTMISGDHLISDCQREVWAALSDFWKQYNEVPSGAFDSYLLSKMPGKTTDYLDMISLYVERIRKLSSSYPIGYVMENVGNAFDKMRLVAGSNEAYQKAMSGDVKQAFDIIHDIKKLSGHAQNDIFMARDWSSDIFVRSKKEFDVGVSFLDTHGFYPQRKTLMLFAAPPGRGKSWFLVNVACRNIALGHKVLYVTLEMDQNSVAIRTLMSLYKIPQRRAEFMATRLNFEDNPRPYVAYGDTPVVRLASVASDPRGIQRYQVIPEGTLMAESCQASVLDGVRSRFGESFGILQYPTRVLTAEQLEVALDRERIRNGFSPDILCVDYGDLMINNSSRREYRHMIFDILAALRKMATERNMAVVTASQTNRESIRTAQSGVISEENYSEAYEAKMGLPDMCLTFSQSREEAQYNLATLLVSKVRGDGPVGERIQIVTNYATGQFCTEDHLITGYKESISEHVERDNMNSSFAGDL
jgi:replicative DNA helicase